MHDGVLFSDCTPTTRMRLLKLETVCAQVRLVTEAPDVVDAGFSSPTWKSPNPVRPVAWVLVEVFVPTVGLDQAPV